VKRDIDVIIAFNRTLLSKTCHPISMPQNALLCALSGMECSYILHEMKGEAGAESGTFGPEDSFSLAGGL